MADQQDVLAAWSSEHRGIEREWQLAEQDEDRPAGELDREELVAMTVRHFVAEEQYLWPLVREFCDDGERLADDGFAQNRTCENALRMLENDSLTTTQVDEALGEVRRILTDHIRLQEGEIFPVLARKVDPARLLALTDDVLGAEQIAPNRPRRVASDSPAASRAESLVEGFVDHIRDAFSRRGER